MAAENEPANLVAAGIVKETASTLLVAENPSYAEFSYTRGSANRDGSINSKEANGEALGEVFLPKNK